MLRETAVRLGRPLHGRARAFALRQAEIVTHADLVAVTKYRRSRRREHHAIREFEATPVAVEHRREPSANATLVELHVRRRPECGEYGLALLRRETSQVEFVVITQEHAPLRCRRALLRYAKRLPERCGVGARHRVERGLIDLEIEHHL